MRASADERLAADVDRRAQDRAASERPGRLAWRKGAAIPGPP